ncbi:MAG TPA: hypothetical protein DCS76_00360 [Gemmatimonadetes bacterium]|jgi:hypothetical protein|nr:hypothetical protein [Gemmatimonadota bacterium]HAT16213.1 hypothetical protein [Gemmatimonadota bacterium]|tara:strand:+ start:1185 stop:1415 length:231 start_codon:yes stop_codon:yes gene_type:complete
MGAKFLGDVGDMKGALGKLTKAVIDRPGVTGTAIGLSKGKPCLKVYVKDRRAASKIPARVDGYHVEVEVTGTFQRR